MFTFDKNRIQLISINDLIKTVERNSQNLNLNLATGRQCVIAWLYEQFDYRRPITIMNRNYNYSYSYSYSDGLDAFIIDENNDIKPAYGIPMTHVLSTLINNKYEFYGRGYDRIGFIKVELADFFASKDIHLDFSAINSNSHARADANANANAAYFRQLGLSNNNQNEQKHEIERLKNENERLKNENKRLENENKELKKGLSEKAKFISSLRLNELTDDDPLAKAIDIRRNEWGGYISTDKTTKPKHDAIVAGLKAGGRSQYLASVIERVACPIAR